MFSSSTPTINSVHLFNRIIEFFNYEKFSRVPKQCYRRTGLLVDPSIMAASFSGWRRLWHWHWISWLVFNQWHNRQPFPYLLYWHHFHLHFSVSTFPLVNNLIIVLPLFPLTFTCILCTVNIHNVVHSPVVIIHLSVANFDKPNVQERESPVEFQALVYEICRELWGVAPKRCAVLHLSLV